MCVYEEDKRVWQAMGVGCGGLLAGTGNDCLVCLGKISKIGRMSLV